jgi:hypothetical protein
MGQCMNVVLLFIIIIIIITISCTCYTIRQYPIGSFTFAQTNCNQLPNGRLAYLSEDDLIDKIRAGTVIIIIILTADFKITAFQY